MADLLVAVVVMPLSLVHEVSKVWWLGESIVCTVSQNGYCGLLHLPKKQLANFRWENLDARCKTYGCNRCSLQVFLHARISAVFNISCN